MKTIILLLFAAIIITSGCSTQKETGSITKNNADSIKTHSTNGEKPSHKRLAPKEPAPVTVKGVEYSAPVSQMGYVNAKELSSGKVLWSKQVYKIDYNGSLEKDVQDFFIDSLWQKGDNIMIHNEKGELYELDPSNQNVTKK